MVYIAHSSFDYNQLLGPAQRKVDILTQCEQSGTESRLWACHDWRRWKLGIVIKRTPTI